MDGILARLKTVQTDDGALLLGDGQRVVPYFACLAALGLVKAGHPEPARRYIRWHNAHREPDGTLFDWERTAGSGWKKLPTRDSTDSYAAVYLELAEALQEKAGIAESLTVLRRERQTNGLTIAKPDYPVCYLMDNIEVWRGLRAAGALAEAEQTLQALERELWDEQARCYRIAVQPDGGKHPATLTQWYPGQMAQLMALAWLPKTPRRRELYRHLSATRRLPKSGATEDAVDQLAWWGLAAQNQDDSELLKQIRHASKTLPKTLYNTALYGHLLRLGVSEAR